MTAPLGKDLLGLEYLSAEQITMILDTAEPLREISERAIKKVPTLRGATVVNLFFEASTRTRISFEFAEKRMSADTVNVATASSSVSKGETLVDTAKPRRARRDSWPSASRATSSMRATARTNTPRRGCSTC
jgi:aspartate carbamoyltransferase catalytic subunit